MSLNNQREMYSVYWGPGARDLGLFPTKQEAEDFIATVISRNQYHSNMRNEFYINTLPYCPDPTTIEL